MESGENHRPRSGLLRLLAERRSEKRGMGLAEQGHESGKALRVVFRVESGENHRLRSGLLRLLAECRREKRGMGLAKQRHESGKALRMVFP